MNTAPSVRSTLDSCNDDRKEEERLNTCLQQGALKWDVTAHGRTTGESVAGGSSVERGVSQGFMRQNDGNIVVLDVIVGIGDENITDSRHENPQARQYVFPIAETTGGSKTQSLSQEFGNKSEQKAQGNSIKSFDGARDRNSSVAGLLLLSTPRIQPKASFGTGLASDYVPNTAASSVHQARADSTLNATPGVVLGRGSEPGRNPGFAYNPDTLHNGVAFGRHESTSRVPTTANFVNGNIHTSSLAVPSMVTAVAPVYGYQGSAPTPLSRTNSSRRVDNSHGHLYNLRSSQYIEPSGQRGRRLVAEASFKERQLALGARRGAGMAPHHGNTSTTEFKTKLTSRGAQVDSTQVAAVAAPGPAVRPGIISYRGEDQMDTFTKRTGYRGRRRSQSPARRSDSRCPVAEAGDCKSPNIVRLQTVTTSGTSGAADYSATHTKETCTPSSMQPQGRYIQFFHPLNPLYESRNLHSSPEKTYETPYHTIPPRQSATYTSTAGNINLGRAGYASSASLLSFPVAGGSSTYRQLDCGMEESGYSFPRVYKTANQEHTSHDHDQELYQGRSGESQRAYIISPPMDTQCTQQEGFGPESAQRRTYAAVGDCKDHGPLLRRSLQKASTQQDNYENNPQTTNAVSELEWSSLIPRIHKTLDEANNACRTLGSFLSPQLHDAFIHYLQYGNSLGHDLESEEPNPRATRAASSSFGQYRSHSESESKVSLDPHKRKGSGEEEDFKSLNQGFNDAKTEIHSMTLGSILNPTVLVGQKTRQAREKENVLQQLRQKEQKREKQPKTTKSAVKKIRPPVRRLALSKSSISQDTEGKVSIHQPYKRAPGRPRKDDPNPVIPRRKSAVPMPGEKPHVGRPRKAEIAEREAFLRSEGQSGEKTLAEERKTSVIGPAPRNHSGGALRKDKSLYGMRNTTATKAVAEQEPTLAAAVALIKPKNIGEIQTPRTSLLRTVALPSSSALHTTSASIAGRMDQGYALPITFPLENHQMTYKPPQPQAQQQIQRLVSSADIKPQGPDVHSGTPGPVDSDKSTNANSASEDAEGKVSSDTAIEQLKAHRRFLGL